MVVGLGDRLARPVLVDVADLEVLEAAAEGTLVHGHGDEPTWTKNLLAPHGRVGDRHLSAIAVPLPEASVGERYGAIWAELPLAHTSTSRRHRGQPGRASASTSRSATAASHRLELHARAAATGSRRRTARQLVTAPITNTGGRAIDVSGELNLSARVTQVGPFRSSTVTLAPGQEGVMVVPIRPATTRVPGTRSSTPSPAWSSGPPSPASGCPSRRRRSASPRATPRATAVPTALVVGAVAAVLVGAGLWMFRARSRHY